ncbi:type IV toxin-antitoxin system AbiEi family antitoxin [Conexibacter sp. CPCC 206217]|uniref:type IV toxin-antitoxin system AbiEi family antitoxin n=1 Tax=Conexibacter sp. CPCC 206217 TaxID=3064574 RepID=UPI002717B638|nr:type IV toxin-antitoxin system AbiEi family antitoxin [Conexibacter sp. CPCC 206217]MDO8209450.1 type IV toxin-antitoxin system AbiEi family antitoxin [Conexibacter sp. CPCC 206217]
MPVLVIAPWIGPRAQTLLVEEQINYLDPTGNVRIQADDPAVFISSSGATRDPQASVRGAARVRGPKSGRLIRALVDVRPPYGVGELADATRLAPGYVSRMLDTLDREALVQRGPRGRVESVETIALLRRWAESYDVLSANAARGFVARDAAEAYAALADMPGRVAVTGSFAAVRLAPVAAPAVLTVYCEHVDGVAGKLGLLPADEGANVVLLRPFDDVVWTGVRRMDAVDTVAPAQIAVDCLTGTGRMPAEGEAVLSWMAGDESSWRADSLAGLSVPAAA